MVFHVSARNRPSDVTAVRGRGGS